MNKKPNGEAKEESPIHFPCDFVIKIMGKANDRFEKSAIAIIAKHFPSLDHSTIQRRFSKDKNYLSLSVTVHAKSKSELDAVYQALTGCEDILISL